MTSRGNKAQADALRAAVSTSGGPSKSTDDVEMASVTRPAVSFDVHRQDLASMICDSFGRLHRLFARGATLQWLEQRSEDLEQSHTKH